MAKNRIFAGIDVGATTTKAVVIDMDRNVLGCNIRRSGIDLASSAKQAFNEALENAGVGSDVIQAIVATGYGRKNVPFVRDTKTEISCHSRGCYHYFPEAITVVDIGGQDNKIIKLDTEGKRIGFKMNRKCAAGTGAFLEEIAYKLDIPLDHLNNIAQNADKTAEIGSYCTVFTATEILDRIRTGEPLDHIVRGLYDSIAKRIIEMGSLTGRVIMTGGVVAHNPIVADLLGARTGIEITIAPHPQEMGAFGAALYAQECSKGGRE
jgi:predicted CoA-substrate-specific enzyme activase